MAAQRPEDLLFGRASQSRSSARYARIRMTGNQRRCVNSFEIPRIGIHAHAGRLFNSYESS